MKDMIKSRAFPVCQSVNSFHFLSAFSYLENFMGGLLCVCYAILHGGKL